MGAPRKYDYDDDLILDRAAGAGSQSEVAARLGIPESSLSKYLSLNPGLREQVRARIVNGGRPGGRQTVSDAQVRTEVLDPVELGDAAELLARRGLIADQWKIRGARVQEYMDGGACSDCGAPRDPFRQLRLDIEPRADLLAPARPAGPTWKVPRAKLRPGDRIALLGDPHAPYDSPQALKAFLAWVDQVGGVSMVVLLGDLLDLPSISRHRSMPGEPTAQECVDRGYEWLRAIREHLPQVEIRWLIGNHDDRIKLFQLDHARPLHGLRQAGGGPELMSLSNVLRLDELDVRIEDPAAGWETGEMELAPGLWAWHAPPSKRQLEVINYSVVHAHHHAMTWRTIPVLGPRNTVVGRRMIAGTGTMADWQGGMGYAKQPGWTTGWAWADVYDDDEHEIAHVRFLADRDEAVWPGGRLSVRTGRRARVAA